LKAGLTGDFRNKPSLGLCANTVHYQQQHTHYYKLQLQTVCSLRQLQLQLQKQAKAVYGLEDHKEVEMSRAVGVDDRDLLYYPRATEAASTCSFYFASRQ